VAELPLLRHHDYPNLVLRSGRRAIENAPDCMTDNDRRITAPEEDTVKQMFLDAHSSYSEFASSRNIQSLDQAISKVETALNLNLDNNPESARLLVTNLGIYLSDRFEALGKITDINNAIERLEVGLALAPDDDPLKPEYLVLLGNAFKNRFQRLGDPEDIDNAIIRHRAAANLMPDCHLHKPICLDTLGTALKARFKQFGNREDIDEAVIQQQVAVRLIPDGHAERPALLNDLGNSLQLRFRRFGDLADMDDAITHQRAAVKLTRDGHFDKPSRLNNLGLSLQFRYERLGNLVDIDDAIARLQEAVSLVPDNDPQKCGFLYNLGGSLRIRFERSGNLLDLDLAISQGRAAVNLTADSHPDKPLALNNLGISLHGRFQLLGNPVDISDAIALQRVAVELTPAYHPDRPRRFSNLGLFLLARFKYSQDYPDLDDAIVQCQTAVNLTADDHREKATRLHNLGDAFLTRFLQFGNFTDAKAAINNLSLCAKSRIGAPSVRFAAVQRWVVVAAFVNQESLLEAYEWAINLMPIIAWLGLPLTDRHEQLVQIGEIARDAAAAAISFEQYEKAIEWLEQGRSIVWNQILQLRTPVDELHIVNSNLADRLLEVSQLIDRGSEQKRSIESAEEDGQRYRALTREWESIVEQIRSLPNFEDFLKPRKLSRLQYAARNGPVIVLNIAMQRCDALALVPGFDEVVHIPLLNITPERITELRDELKDLLYSDGLRMRGQRAAKKVEDEDEVRDCAEILSELWNGIVKPVLDSLAFSVCMILMYTPQSNNVFF
jgi:hypothetical protein